MSNFVKSPNLPSGKVTAVLIGERYLSRLEKPLNYLGIEVILIPDNPVLPESLSGHADMSVLHLGGKLIVLAQAVFGSREFVNLLTKRGVTVISSECVQRNSYPYDCGLNMCVMGKLSFHNLKYSDKSAVSLCKAQGLSVVNVRQGYSKCSVCPVDENSFITSDAGIYRKARELDMDCLLINPGGILLPGFDTGFIGGSAFKPDANLLAFTGEIQNREDRLKIERFLERRGMMSIYLTHDPIFDIGSIIPIFE